MITRSRAPRHLAAPTYLFALVAQKVYGYATPVPHEVEFGLTLYNMTVNGAPAVLSAYRLKSASPQSGDDLKQAPEASAEFAVRVGGQWTPGQAAFALAVQVYPWFGFDEEAIPYVVEDKGIRVISPDKILEDEG